MKKKSDWPVFLPNPDWSLGDWCAWLAIVFALGAVFISISIWIRYG